MAADPRPLLMDFQLMMDRPTLLLERVAALLDRPLPGLADQDLARRYRERMDRRMQEIDDQPNNWIVPNPHKEQLKGECSSSWRPAMAPRWPGSKGLYERLVQRSRR